MLSCEPKISKILDLPRCKNLWSFSLFCSYCQVTVYYVDFFVFFALRNWWVSQVFTPRLSQNFSRISDVISPALHPQKSTQHVRECAAVNGAICSKKKKMDPNHRDNPNTRNGERLNTVSVPDYGSYSILYFVLRSSPHYRSEIWKRRFYPETHESLFVHITPEIFENTAITVILDLCLIKTRLGKSRDYHMTSPKSSVFKMFHSKQKFQIPRFEKRVLQKLGFCDELVWMVALTVEIKVTVWFQISLGGLQSIKSINQSIYL